MPRVKPGQRKRGFGPKRRSGCPTCKVRHVRCDEARPACQNCISTGRRCDGYKTSDSNISQKPSDTALIKPVNRGLALYVETSPQETRAFFYYLRRTAPYLSSGFDNSLFWEQLVPRSAFADQGIRHALIALASCHENFQNRDWGSVENAHFTLRQYNTAIAKYVSLNDGPDQEGHGVYYLLSCLIFICIELIRGHYCSALVLLRQGLRMISDESILREQSSVSGPCSCIFAECRSILLRLEVQAIGLVGGKAWGPEHPLHLGGHQPAIPAVFSSVTEARDSLATSRLSFFLHALGSKTEHTPDRYSNTLQRWSTAFDGFLAGHEDNLTEREKCGVHVLKIQRLILCGFISAGVNREDVHRGNQTLWDKSHYLFEEIVSLAENALLDATGNDPSICIPQFTVDIGFVGSLYDVARRCRDPIIRRRAIHLLRSSARQEGFWDGQLAARVAERVVEMEESDLGNVATSGDVPNWARVAAVLPVFDLEKRSVTSRFIKSSQLRAPRADIQEVYKY